LLTLVIAPADSVTVPVIGLVTNDP
jgi:hypothetical protein